MTRLRNAALFLALAAVWGAAFMAIEVGLEYVPPVLFAAVRYDVAGVLMLGYAAHTLDDPLSRSRADVAAGFAALTHEAVRTELPRLRRALRGALR